MVGWESGRRHEFASDQYTPFVLLKLVDGVLHYVAVNPGVKARWIDCTRLEDSVRISVGGDNGCSIRILSSDLQSATELRFAFAASSVKLDGDVVSIRQSLHNGGNECQVTFAGTTGSLQVLLK